MSLCNKFILFCFCAMLVGSVLIGDANANQLIVNFHAKEGIACHNHQILKIEAVKLSRDVDTHEIGHA
ncbi:hypothetical protein QQP08_009324 [Theobroma cacao]|nr:hypothetical protein QQP08_009324 [Theobroma cacao]